MSVESSDQQDHGWCKTNPDGLVVKHDDACLSKHHRYDSHDAAEKAYKELSDQITEALKNAYKNGYRNGEHPGGVPRGNSL